MEARRGGRGALPSPAGAPPLTDHRADPVVLQPKAQRRFLGAGGRRLRGARGVPAAATSAAPTAPATASIRLLLRPPFRSLGHCRASPRSNDPGRGVGVCFSPRHGSVKKIRRVRRRSRPALHVPTAPSETGRPKPPRSRFSRRPREASPPRPGLPLVDETSGERPSRVDQSALLVRAPFEPVSARSLFLSGRGTSRAPCVLPC